MKRRAMLLMACLMILMNTFIFLYLDKILKQEISIYVIQVGRYDKQENADEIIKQLKELNYEGYSYQDDNIVVISKIVLKQNEANTLAKELSQKGITCVVKEYLIDKKYEQEIINKKYENVYKELK